MPVTNETGVVNSRKKTVNSRELEDVGHLKLPIFQSQYSGPKQFTLRGRYFDTTGV